MTGFPKERGGLGAVGQCFRDFKRRLVGRLAFLVPPAWQSSCGDGLPKFKKLRVSESHDLQAYRFTEVAVRLLVRGFVCSIEWSDWHVFTCGIIDLSWVPLCHLKEERGSA